MNPRRYPTWTCAALLGGALAVALAGCGGGKSDAAIGGNVSGLAAGSSLVLQNNGSDSVTLAGNGSFEFPRALKSSASYAVTVLTQPSGQLCAVDNGSGTVDGNADAVRTVALTCVSMATVGGTVSGLAPGTAVTLGNGAVLLPVAIDGPFSFPGLLAAGSSYAITVATQPVGETCTVLNGSGTVAAGSAVDITVACAP